MPDWLERFAGKHTAVFLLAVCFGGSGAGTVGMAVFATPTQVDEKITSAVAAQDQKWTRRFDKLETTLLVQRIDQKKQAIFELEAKKEEGSLTGFQRQRLNELRIELDNLERELK